MENISGEVKRQSIASLQSTIRKLEKGLAQMSQKGANTTLIEKRLRAHHIALAVLEFVWQQKPHSFHEEDLEEARNTLSGLFPSIQSNLAKAKPGSPQRTLLERRKKAMELANQAMDAGITEEA